MPLVKITRKHRHFYPKSQGYKLLLINIFPYDTISAERMFLIVKEMIDSSIQKNRNYFTEMRDNSC